MFPSSEEKIAVRLSRSEALVLFEFVSRFSESSTLSIADQAEERVLWDICCLLEKELVEPMKAEYAELLAEARKVVRDAESA